MTAKTRKKRPPLSTIGATSAAVINSASIPQAHIQGALGGLYDSCGDISPDAIEADRVVTAHAKRYLTKQEFVEFLANNCRSDIAYALEMAQKTGCDTSSIDTSRYHPSAFRFSSRRELSQMLLSWGKDNLGSLLYEKIIQDPDGLYRYNVLFGIPLLFEDEEKGTEE